MVTGLPSSASWQDLKVLALYITSICSCFCKELIFFLFRTICDGLVMSVFLMYTVRLEVSDNNFFPIISWQCTHWEIEE